MVYFLGLITRCKDEYFIKEFCEYYIWQGVDKIYIIDDDSNDKSIYDGINDDRVDIVYEKDIIKRDFANDYYKEVRNNFEWMIYCDVDEFITTKRNFNKTIREELTTTFKDVDCIMIPWVMMSCNGIEKNPKSVLEENIYRWNHDERHPSKVYKFRCRYENIEVKCIFKSGKFKSIVGDHHPNGFEKNNVNVVDSIRCNKNNIGLFYSNLREEDIKIGYLLCYHYRIISVENSLNKIKTNIWYINDGYKINDLMSSDHPDLIDKTIMYKINTIRRKTIFIHVGKCGGSYLNTIFPGINEIHMRQAIFKTSNSFILIVRNPIDRFVSAYYHSRWLIEYDVKDYKYKDLFNNIDSPYYKLKWKIKGRLEMNNPFGYYKNGDKYKELIMFFDGVNDLAESLSCSDDSRRAKAKELMNMDIEHISKGLGYYLHNGKWLLENGDKIIYCEDINEMDISKISLILNKNVVNDNSKKVRMNSKEYDKRLSVKSIVNIKEFYKDTDYKVLSMLKDKKIISDELFKKYQDYEKKK